MNPVLEKYNSIANEPIETMEELENRAKFLQHKVFSENESLIVYKCFYSCFLHDKENNPHVINYYALECGARDCRGDVDKLVTTEYGLI